MTIFLALYLVATPLGLATAALMRHFGAKKSLLRTLWNPGIAFLDHPPVSVH
jgi:hypothetical protein